MVLYNVDLETEDQGGTVWSTEGGCRRKAIWKDCA